MTDKSHGTGLFDPTPIWNNKRVISMSPDVEVMSINKQIVCIRHQFSSMQGSPGS